MFLLSASCAGDRDSEGYCAEIHELHDDCCCYVVPDDGVSLCRAASARCVVSVTCPAASFVPGEGCSLSGADSVDTTVAAGPVGCALAYLRDDTPSTITITHSADSGLPSTTWHLDLYGQREVLVFRLGKAESEAQVRRDALRSPQHFEMCAGLGSGLLRLECLQDFAEGEPIELCPG